jgi:chemotaxis protein CheX
METVTMVTLFRKYLERCSLELFTEYGVELASLQASPPPSVHDEVAGIIGFAGDQMKGSLLLATTFAVVKQTYPASSSGEPSPTSDVLVDWTSELANQLLGRVKNQLLLHGVSFIVSTPVSLAGDSLAQSKLVTPNQHRIVLHMGAGAVRVSIDAEVDPDLKILAEPMRTEEAGVASEGDLLLF